MKDNHDGRIHVANIAQKALLECELQGQISDGHWENSRPYNHWINWCRAKVFVAPEDLGINFFSHRAYDFLSEDLLKVVRTRMILYVRLAQKFSTEEQIKAAEHLFETISSDSYCMALEAPEFTAEVPDWIKNAAEKDDASECYKKLYAELVAMLTDADLRNYLEHTCTKPIKTREAGVYNLKQLKLDLAELKKIQHLRNKER